MKHLPNLYLITPEPCNKFLYKLESCLEQGIRLVQLRAKTISESEYYSYAEQSLKLCENYNAQLLVNTSIEIALSIGAHGVHLNSTRLYSYSKHSLKIELAAASCHNLADIQQANKIGLNLIVLSPVKTTASHPDAKTLGWKTFSNLTKHSNCPVFALGGMKRQDITTAYKYGAHGIAAIRALWNNFTEINTQGDNWYLNSPVQTECKQKQIEIDYLKQQVSDLRDIIDLLKNKNRK